MKLLQNNFTTPEQSKRLLELGVPADSADCFYINDEYRPNVRDELYERNTGYKFPFSEEGFTPCWSVGRLIEIMALCYKFDLSDSGSVKLYATDIKKRIVVDVLISDIERFINKIDFSKLEE